MAEFPRDLITEILLYLPVKSLLRFRSASKFLCSLIDSVEFANWHLITTSAHMVNRKMIFQDRCRRFYICDMNAEDNKCKRPLSLVQNQVYGYCNGLLLLSGNSLDAALWNPSTCQCWNLPSCPPTGFHRIIGSGLGFDSSTCEYKVAIILCTQPNHVQFWVFGVKSNAWRRVEDVPFETIFVGDAFMPEPSTGYFADGGLHWLTSRILDKNSQQVILTFDLKKETFSLVPLPVFSTRTDEVVTGLHVLDGSLCVSFYYYCKPLQADLYRRERDGSWTQLYSIKQPIVLEIYRFHDVRVLGYSKSSRKEILLDFGMEDLVAYDVERTTFRKDETKRSPFWHHPILCIESLWGIQWPNKTITM